MIRQYEENWFVANDIARVTGYKNPSIMLQKVPPEYTRRIPRHTDRWLINREGALMLVPHLDELLTAENEAIWLEFGIKSNLVSHIPGALAKMRAIKECLSSDPSSELLVAKEVLEYFLNNAQVTSEDLGNAFGLRLGHGKPIFRATALLETIGVEVKRLGTARRGDKVYATYTADTTNFKLLGKYARDYQR